MQTIVQEVKEHRKKMGWDKLTFTTTRLKYVEECKEAMQVVELCAPDHRQKEELADNLITLIAYVDSKGWDLVELVRAKIKLNESRKK